MPCRPRAPIVGHRSIGKLSERSISAARGAILADAKACTVSRSASSSGPRAKSRPGFCMMIVLGLSLDSLAILPQVNQLKHIWWQRLPELIFHLPKFGGNG